MNNTILGIIIGLIPGVIGVYINNKWNKRHETYRIFRDALDMLKETNLESKTLGADILEELLNSELLQKEDKNLIHNIHLKVAKQTINGGTK